MKRAAPDPSSFSSTGNSNLNNENTNNSVNEAGSEKSVEEVLKNTLSSFSFSNPLPPPPAIDLRNWRPKEIPPENFYGEVVDEEWKAILQKLRTPIDFAEKELVPAYFRQEDAFKACDSQSTKTLTWAFEREEFNGGRRYVVKSYETFWDIYSRLRDEKRTFYEVIRENYPCCLYFDVEFNKELNPGIDGDVLLQIFLEMLFVEIAVEFSVISTNSHVLQLDSSTSEKFSRHVLVKNVVFASNADMGRFVHSLALKIHQEKDSELGNLFVNKEPNKTEARLLELERSQSSQSEVDFTKKTLIIDLAVYSRNRYFRIYKSTKLGKNRPLILLPTCQFQYSDEKDLFFKSLICYVDHYIDPRTGKHPKILTYSLLPGSIPSIAKLRFLDGSSSSSPSTLNSIASKTSATLRSTASNLDNEPSPYPHIDLGMKLALKSWPGSPNAQLRSWQYYADSKTLVYVVQGNRYCENIGREHKSNSIFFVVDITAGLFYQKCFDPECARFRSRPRQVPFAGVPQVQIPSNLKI